MIGCSPPIGYISSSDGQTLPPRVVAKNVDTGWITSRQVEEGETLWSENLFIFAGRRCGDVGGGDVGGLPVPPTEDAEWNRTASAIWSAMTSIGDEQVKYWAMGFTALMRALFVLSKPHRGAVFFIEARPISPQTDSVAVSLAALLVKGFKKLKGFSPMEPIPATWLLMSLQEGGIPLHDASTQNAAGLYCFLSFAQKAARVPLRAAANAILSVTGVTEAGDVEVRCTAVKPILKGTQVRLHLGRCLDACLTVSDSLKPRWESYCGAIEELLLVAR
ncbi:hypothetical protein DQ04_01611120 [Trypanosoma grayi]|uniref:hypothetical protein n=1 Tax=Trypanosoma grayi TaxID=71804 RepID=UPI0004F4669B|nr:hypothetical protein DQ04_01611120 [Trypanosoma grayi]KEG12570.1 hypothetical protein DQ04_01611120 [Trypanosoma grayi]